jgi:hypothetical protein
MTPPRPFAGALAGILALMAPTVAIGSTAGAAAPDEAPNLIIVSGSARVSGSTLRIESASIDWLHDEPTRSKGEMSAARVARKRRSGLPPGSMLAYHEAHHREAA